MNEQMELEIPPAQIPSPVSFVGNGGPDTEAMYFQGTRPLSISELESLFSVAKRKPRNAALVLTLYHTGLRISEAAALKWSDLSFSLDAGRPGYLRLRRGTTKGKRQGMVLPLHPRAQSALRGWMESSQKKRGLKPADFVFPGSSPTRQIHRASAWEVVKRLYARAGITGPGCALHSLRKSFGTNILAQTRSVETVRRALRHARLETSRAYIAQDSSEVAQAILSI